ncbi:putative signal transducing protein [Winogradskyella sp. HB-48]|uniref:putative signal transducing protein n=1 Tax=Winogradskyella sp. HB-48 TaxID=3416808 RepID=UPI003CF33D62
MNASEYNKIYEGNFVLITRIKSELENNGIIPIIKDEGESQRLAGYGSLNQGFQEIYVHEDELDKAIAIVEQVKAEMDAPS